MTTTETIPMTPEQWLAKGGDIPAALADDDAWLGAVDRQLTGNLALALPVLAQPSRYAAGLALVGTSLDGLRGNVARKLDQGVRIMEEKFADRPLPAVFAKMIRRMLDLPGDRARQVYPFIRPEQVSAWQQHLLAGNHDVFAKLLQPAAGSQSLADVLSCPSRGQSSTQTADRDLQYAILGAAAQVVASPRPVSVNGRLLLATLALRPASDRAGDYRWTELLTRLGNSETQLDAAMASVKAGNFSALTTPDVPEGVEALLAKCPDIIEVLSKMNLPIDLKMARFHQMLARLPGGSMDVWPRLTAEALRNTDAMAAEARAILERVGQSGGVDMNWEKPETMVAPSLWQRRRHAEGWTEARSPAARAKVQALVREEVAGWARGASPVGVIRGVLLEAWIAGGAEKAGAVARKLEYDASEAANAYEAFLNADRTFFQGAGVALPRTLARRLIETPAAALATELGIDVPLASRLKGEAVGSLKQRFIPADQWLAEFLVRLLGDESHAPATAALRKIMAQTGVETALLDGDATRFHKLPADQRVRLAEGALALGIDCRRTLEEYLAEQEKRILASPSLADEANQQRVREELELCRQAILEGPHSPQAAGIEPSLLEAVRAGNAAAFRQAPRQAAIKPNYREEQTPGERIKRELVSVRGVAAVIVLVPLLWMAVIYLIGSSRPATNSAGGPATAATFDPESLGLVKGQFGGGTVWMSAFPASEKQYGSIIPKLDGSPSNDTRPAEVSFAEAVRWCELYDKYLRNTYPRAFEPGGPLASAVLRLPTLSEWRQLRAQRTIGASSADFPEWVYAAESPKGLADVLPTAPDDKPQAAVAPHVGFRFILAPRPAAPAAPKAPDTAVTSGAAQ